MNSNPKKRGCPFETPFYLLYIQIYGSVVVYSSSSSDSYALMTAS